MTRVLGWGGAPSPQGRRDSYKLLMKQGSSFQTEEQSKGEAGEVSKGRLVKEPDAMFGSWGFFLRAVKSPGVVFSWQWT